MVLEYDTRDLTDLVETLEKAAVWREEKAPRRRYLGMSELGDPCRRKLWLRYHGYSAPLTPHLARIFAHGDVVENKLIGELEQSGFTITDRQTEFQALDGRVKGHCDGVIEYRKKRRILEIKSANDAAFKKFVAKGCYSNPRYYGQVQLYMGRAGMTTAIFIVENKNTQELYVEKIYYNRAVEFGLLAKAERILELRQPDPPLPKERNGGCFLCDLKAICGNYSKAKVETDEKEKEDDA